MIYWAPWIQQTLCQASSLQHLVLFLPRPCEVTIIIIFFWEYYYWGVNQMLWEMKSLIQNLSGFVPRDQTLLFSPCEPDSEGERPTTADFYCCLSLCVRQPDLGDQVGLNLEMGLPSVTALDPVGRKMDGREELAVGVCRGDRNKQLLNQVVTGGEISGAWGHWATSSPRTLGVLVLCWEWHLQEGPAWWVQGTMP